MTDETRKDTPQPPSTFLVALGYAALLVAFALIVAAATK